tara:strand:- start:582 stop:749 length:168 start_codon:yes stop_codon:yes gene_type:complete
MDRHFTPAELEENDWLAKKFPMAICECGEVTLGGDDVTFPEGKATFTPHTHKGEA